MLKVVGLAVLILMMFPIYADNLSEQQGSNITLRYGVDPLGAWVPFDRTDDPNNPGVFIELIPLLMAKANFKVEQQKLPTKRGLRALKEGELDFDFINLDWISTHEKDRFVYSIPLFEVTEYFISLADNSSSFDTAEQAYGQLVGTVAGYYYFDDAKFTRADFRSESEVMLGLHKKRFDVAIMENAAAIYWADKHKVQLKFGAVHTKGPIVLRLRLELEDLLPAINMSALKLKEEGKISSILERYVGNK